MRPRCWHFDVALPDPDDRQEVNYVGLYFDKKKQVQVLKLPHAYETLPLDDPHACLGTLMRAIAYFSTSISKHAFTKDNQDGFLSKQNGGRLVPGNGRAPEYSRMDACIRLIRQLQDPSLLAIARVPGLVSRFSEREIARSLPYAVYLSDGTPVFEQMIGRSTQLQRMTTHLVDLAAWVALDALDHLFPDIAARVLRHSLRVEWEALAMRFINSARLKANASLFDAGSNATLDVVRSTLSTCIRTDPPVREETRQLYDLLDRYLNATLTAGGTIHGFAGFNRVWEALCLDRARECFGDEDIFCCDDALVIGAEPARIKAWRDNRERVFAHNGTARRPDLVLRLPEGRFCIVDFKYSPEFSPGASFFDRRPASPDLTKNLDTPDKVAKFKAACKANQDVSNIEAYRWLLMQHELKSTDETLVDLEFWVPAPADMPSESVNWLARTHSGSVPGSEFRGLQVRYQPTRAMIERFANKFAFF